MKNRLTYLTAGFWGDERGTSMTEFIITLPVVVIIFAGLVGLGRLGHHAGRVKIEATKQMWEKAYDDSSGSITPRQEFSNGGEFGDVFDSIATAGAGHWGESYTRVKLASTVPMLADGVDPVMTSDSIVGESMYARTLVDDSLVPPSGNTSMSNNASWSIGLDPIFSAGGSVGGALSYAISASGVLPNQAAGIKYGWVEGEVENEEVAGFLGQTVNMSTRYRTLVPPDTRSESRAWWISWAVAQSQMDNHFELLEWNKADLESESLSVDDYESQWEN
jgi:hypothetical protein